jgi:paraquat-inducible protein A
MTAAELDRERSGDGDLPLIACHECDLLQREISIPPGKVARCARCGAKLYRSPHATLDHTLSYNLTAAVVFIVANAYPIVGINIQGTRHDTTLLGAARALWAQEMTVISLLVFLTTFLMPALEIAFMLHLLLPLRAGRRPAGLDTGMRILRNVSPWGMVEVFLLGVLVALVKLTHFARVIPGLALWSFGVLILLMAAAAASFDIRDVWERADAGGEGRGV